MGSTFFGKNGKTFDRNIAAGDYLTKITVGLWDKFGCFPKSEEDCKLVARILRNRAHLNQYWSPYHEEAYGFEKKDQDTIDFDLELAEFFDTCGGCLSEGEYYKKYPVFMTWTLVGRWMYNLNSMIQGYIEVTNKKE